MNTGIILRSTSVHPPTTTQMEVKDCHTLQGSDIFAYLLATSRNEGSETWTPTPNDAAGPSRTRRNNKKNPLSSLVTSPKSRGTLFDFFIPKF